MCAVTTPREDPADRVRPICGGTPQAARARQAGDLQLPGLHLHLRQEPRGGNPCQTDAPAGPQAREAQDEKRGLVAAHPPADPQAGTVAAVRCPWLLQLPRSANQRSCTACVPASCHRSLAAHAAASQPKGSVHMGSDDALGGRLAPETNHPPSLAKRSLRRHTPEVGAVCGKAARTVLVQRGSLPLPRVQVPPAEESSRCCSYTQQRGGRPIRWKPGSKSPRRPRNLGLIRTGGGENSRDVSN